MHLQQIITHFFNLVTLSCTTNQPRNTLVGSQPGQSKGVTIDQAIEMGRAHWARAARLQPHRPCHRQIKIIIARQGRHLSHFRDLFVLEQPMLEIL